MKRMSIQKLLPALCLLFLFMASSLVAQPPVNRRSKARPAAPKVKAEDEKKAEKKEDTWLWIKNVDVYPVNGAVQRQAEILIKNDKVHAIGSDLDAPKDCETVDGQGMRAYPGLVALNGSGLIPSLRGGKGDNLDPKGLLTQIALAHGITTVISGTSAVKLDANATSDAMLRSGLYIGLQYSSSNPANKKRIREEMQRALVYMRALRAGLAGKAKSEAAKKLGSASRHLPLLEGKQIAVFNVDTHQDIVDACGLAESFGFRAVVRGAAEGWTAPGAMGRANVSAILTPRLRRDPDEKLNRPTGSNMANASILHDHGVVIGIATQSSGFDSDGGPGRDALGVTWDAGAAVSGGLSEAAALKAITLNAARIFALDDRIGSLEIGKDADVVICDGEMLHYKTQVYYTVVNGKISYDRSKQALYRHIRPRDPKQAGRQQWWPRRITPMPDSWSYDPAAADKKLAAEKKVKEAAEAIEKAAADEKKAAADKKKKGAKKEPEKGADKIPLIKTEKGK
ncbi:MAG: hypothetical protein ACI97A_000263 [Planctomycetota bacterium]|jgi:hypothetical protein